jgi:transitional endoplasmic reticulum ATPase
VAELFREFESAIVAPDGITYSARACGSEARDGTPRWHGWIEFVDRDSGTTIRTQRETTQRSRTDTAYWANGLTPRYLEGTLQRALNPTIIWIRHSRRPRPTFDAPAPDRISVGDCCSHITAAPKARPVVAQPKPVPAPSPTSFASVGGMSGLKEQIRRIVETIHLHRDRARSYGIIRNGILLYGPPGCGKTFFAQATAGEFGLRFLRVPLESAVTKYIGGAPEAMDRVFREARARTPCLLLFDEFDAIACKRDELVTVQDQQMVNALLEQLDAHREAPGLLIVAATNRFEDLDPAVIRDGRFDYKVRIPEPDFDARREILRVLLNNRPHASGINMARLARDLEGFSAARIQNLVNEAALLALEAGVPIANRHLRAGYRAQTTASRYGGARLGWDDLILPTATKQKLQSIEKFIEKPQLARRLGVTPPSGILLFGPPGTGKTTIARVLASETDASFLAVNAAEIFSKWLGESERQVKELFARAHERLPAIVFLDEIDAVVERRGEALSGADHARNAVVNTFLAEMDGIDASTRIFVIGATNRPELLDEALLRPGRLGETIEIPLPGRIDRLTMLKLFSKKMRLDSSVELEHLATRTEGASGADLRGLCTLAGRNAFLRGLETAEAAPAVTGDDFERALDELRTRPTWTRTGRPIGFRRESI